jgi:hypothetical protein
LKKKSKRKTEAAQTLFGSFNIQVFGKEKMKKEPVKEILVKILTRYDVFTIQEIRDASGEAFPELIAALNDEEDRYDFHVGERQGRAFEILPCFPKKGIAGLPNKSF